MIEEMASWVHESKAAGIKVGFGKRGSANLGFDHARDVSSVAALRRALGPGPRIMVDLGVRNRWTLPEAVRRIRAFEEHDVYWVEEPLGADDPAGYRELRDKVTTLIAYGEREWNPGGVRRIVETGTVDVVGIDPGRCQGVTGFREAAAIAASARRQVNAHAWSSGIVSAASLALTLNSPNCAQLEFKPLRNPMQHDLVSPAVEPDNGMFRVPTRPGLGIEVDESFLAAHLLT